MTLATWLLVLDLAGTFVFALNGALTALRVAKLDLIGVCTLGIITAIGGGLLRDVLIGDLPPATLRLWYYLAVAIAGGLIVFAFGHRLHRVRVPLLVLDAAGLSLFAVVGTTQALAFGLGVLPAVLLGAITAVGGGTIRDMMVRQIPTVLHSELYVVPALAGACIVVAGHLADLPMGWVAVAGAGVCFGIRGIALKYRLNAPLPRTGGREGAHR